MNRKSLLLASVVLALSLALTFMSEHRIKSEDYAVKTGAAARLERCMEQIKAYKAELGIPISEEDRHETGMLGQGYTQITTTIGSAEAKRTTANPDMAALVVQLLREAGVKAGDTVGAGFSGSFPAMNLAVLCACAEMDVRVIYIASVGASTYGANQPELTFPDMVYRLAEDGLVPAQAAAFSLGGDFDCGEEMFPEVREPVRARVEAYGVPFLYEQDYAANLSAREKIYAEQGPISCFIGVGGNVTTMGLDGDRMDWGVTRAGKVQTVNENSGLLERYNAAGLPVICLLNIKKLVAEYGLPYDPQEISPIGESAIYYHNRYCCPIAALGVLLAVAVLLWDRRSLARKGEK